MFEDHKMKNYQRIKLKKCIIKGTRKKSCAEQCFVLIEKMRQLSIIVHRDKNREQQRDVHATNMRSLRELLRINLDLDRESPPTPLIG